MATATKKVVRGDNAVFIRKVWTEVDENAEHYVSEFGIDLRAFKRALPTMHGKVFATLRKKGVNIDSATVSLINKFRGVNANGIELDTLLSELDEVDAEEGNASDEAA